MNDSPPPFKLTYATMFEPPEEMHARFEEAAARLRGHVGAEHAMWIGGRNERAPQRFDLRTPIDHRLVLGRFQAGDPEHAIAAVTAAEGAQRDWSRMPWTSRVAVLRRAAALIEERVFFIAAALALEVGKNRMEALGEVQESADLIAYYCDQMEEHDGYVRGMLPDPVPGFTTENTSVMKPHGVWAVIAPFNFPFALAAGPSGAALVAGNTVVLKSASATPWSGRLLADVLRDAGVPSGAFNYVTGPGGSIGEALVRDARVAGLTFTGSYEVGMHLYRTIAGGAFVRPCIAEMGGKNAAIVTRRAHIADAALGVMRSAFGLSGQKCSACSRVYVERSVFNDFMSDLHQWTEAVKIGDPLKREYWIGPVINDAAVARFEDAVSQVRALGNTGAIVHGGERLDHGELAHGFYCAPTIARAPLDHPLWQRELFAPFVLVAPVENMEQAIELVNASPYGLTAGFYGADEESERFFDEVQAGVLYANRAQGATTGAWPGYQPFGGWKGSGSTGRSAGSIYYVPQYLREQSQTRVRRE